MSLAPSPCALTKAALATWPFPSSLLLRFILTAVDGGSGSDAVDRLRLQVTTLNGATLVFDNNEEVRDATFAESVLVVVVVVVVVMVGVGAAEERLRLTLCFSPHSAAPAPFPPDPPHTEGS